MVAAQNAPVSRGERFTPVPYFCYRTQGELQLVERDAVFEEVELDCFPKRPLCPGFKSSNRRTLRGLSRRCQDQGRPGGHRQLDFGTLPADVNEDDLVRWLDPEVRQPDIAQAHLRAFLKAVVM